jgi:hypothetical protein
MLLILIGTIAMVTTVAGSTEGCMDGSGVRAKLNYPIGICINPQDQCFYICDHGNNAIRKLTTQGILLSLFI